MFKLLFLSLLLQFSALTLIHAYSPYGSNKVGTQPGASDISAYDYDSIGNRLSGRYLNNSYTVSYGLIGKPVSIKISTIGTEHFKHRPGGIRYLRVNADGDKTFYIGDSEYQINADGIKMITYIRNGAYSPIAQVNISSSTPNYNFYLHDHQGSTLGTVDSNGTALNLKRHDPWGVPVAPTGVDLSQDDINDKARDFTGHERIKSAGLIHANARVYDPLVGFISPDPIIYNTSSIASLNRYLYVRNNPLNATDPSGFTEYRFFNKASARRMNLPPDTRFVSSPITTAENQHTLSHFAAPSGVTDEEIAGRFNVKEKSQNIPVNNTSAIFTTEMPGLGDSVYNVTQNGNFRIAPRNRSSRDPNQFALFMNSHVIFTNKSDAKFIANLDKLKISNKILNFDRENQTMSINYKNVNSGIEEYHLTFYNNPQIGLYPVEITINGKKSNSIFNAHMGRPVNNIIFDSSTPAHPEPSITPNISEPPAVVNQADCCDIL